MIINFVGNFQKGYVGEVSDETHLALELERQGHEVRLIPRDEWREYVIENQPEGKYPNIPKDLRADFNIIAKWHHFYDGSFILKLKELSDAPVFYWVWDYMLDGEFPDWHIKMALAADRYLSGEAGIFDKYKILGVKPHYFQMDVCDGNLPVFDNLEKIHDVIFTGSCIGQGNRREYLQIINKQIPVKIWSWNYQEWQKLGFEAYPAVYGEEYNKLIAQSRIVLGLSVEPNCWGYWSNRVGKVIKAGGFLLQEYAPGMETQLDGYQIDFFNSPNEAIEKINQWLKTDKDPFVNENVDKWTSTYKMKQLGILMERFLKSEAFK